MARPVEPATDCRFSTKVAVGAAQAMESRELGRAELELQANADCHFAGPAVDAGGLPVRTVGTKLPPDAPSLHTAEPCSAASAAEAPAGEHGARQPRVGEADGLERAAEDGLPQSGLDRRRSCPTSGRNLACCYSTRSKFTGWRRLLALCTNLGTSSLLCRLRFCPMDDASSFQLGSTNIRAGLGCETQSTMRAR